MPSWAFVPDSLIVAAVVIFLAEALGLTFALVMAPGGLGSSA